MFENNPDLFRVITENASIGIALVKERKIEWLNSRLEETLGYSKDELIGKSTRRLYPSQDEFESIEKKSAHRSDTGKLTYRFCSKKTKHRRACTCQSQS